MGKKQSRPVKPLEARIDAFLSSLTGKEKVSLLSGIDVWNTMPLERLGIQSVVMTDGPHGVRAGNPEMGRIIGPATCFPTGVAMGASWDPDLIERVGEALGEETTGMGCDVLLGPCINIIRAPLGGRNFETYSEDPYLTGQLGVGFVRGVQSRGVGTSLKHFACNNQEIERFRSSSNMDERTLREIYLAAFETVVKEAKPWTVMCSYNRINGVYASQNHYLLKEILKGEWAYEGAVISDWDANHTIFESIQGGLDLEMPGPAKYYGRLLEQAIVNWQIEIDDVDDAVRRILRLIVQTGKHKGGVRRKPGKVNTPEHQVLARQLAEEAIVLLKNDRNILPIDKDKIKTIAVIGPNADEGRIGGGGSSYVIPPYRISPLQGLESRLGPNVHIKYARGCDNFINPPVVSSDWLLMPDKDGTGLKGEYYDNPDFHGLPTYVKQDPRLDFWWFSEMPGAVGQQRSAARWTGFLKVPDSGEYRLILNNSGHCRILINGELVLENIAPTKSAHDQGITNKDALVKMTAGKLVPIRIDFIRHENQDFAHWRLCMHLWHDPATDDRIDLAAEAARQSEVALVFAGMPEGFETEGRDRPNMDLPSPQDELIRRVVQANPNTVVVLNAGSPVCLPWLEQVPVVLEAFYPGMEGGNAIARVLLGEVNPSGKLPVTFPKRIEDNPAFINNTHPGARDINYGEGIFVGYRYYDKRKIEPAFPFGHGLSYTQFSYGDIQIDEKVVVGDPFQVRIGLRNTGKIAGKEVVQLYVRDVESSLPRPIKELKGFQKVHLQPGEENEITFTLTMRDLSFYDPYRKGWVAELGDYEILIGSSSQDIRSRAKFNLINPE